MILEPETTVQDNTESTPIEAATETTMDTAELTDEQKKQAEATARTVKMLEELDKAGRKLIMFVPPMATETASLLDKTLEQLNVLCIVSLVSFL